MTNKTVVYEAVNKNDGTIIEITGMLMGDGHVVVTTESGELRFPNNGHEVTLENEEYYLRNKETGTGTDGVTNADEFISGNSAETEKASE